MLGPFAAELALFRHSAHSSETVDLIERTADDVLLPLVGTTLRSAIADYAPTAGLALHGRGLAFSSAKESEDGEWLVLRCVNLTEETVNGSWDLPSVTVRFEQTIRARVSELAGGVTAWESAGLPLQSTAEQKGSASAESDGR